ncbi:HD domain-containing phosphohydrolase [Gilvimarinus agarilyticus]|uniref:HD domain-containing phosphohydrolase n=1 Tax=Gilvimarinus agarilyticus TaxID=679259 RepID=UPI0005A1898C|nr:HD domain-containing phosphohydrolase [Gilvimarinus agarilyticus]
MEGKKTILVVDDTPENIDVLVGLLSLEYRVRAATRGVKALELAASDHPPDLILLDIMMPEMDGFEVCRRLKANPLTASIPVIFVTAKIEVSDEIQGFELGATDYLSKPISPPILLRRVKTQLALADQTHALQDMVLERTAELELSQLQVVHCLGRAAGLREKGSNAHALRISRYSRMLGEEAGMGPVDAALLLNASLMYDVGKIGLPDELLETASNPGKGARAIIDAEIKFGVRILGNDNSPLLTMARTIVTTFREHYDGNGYPKGLKGSDIPLVGRIVAIANMFETLTTQRAHTEAYTVPEALVQLEACAGVQFDPELVRRFCSAESEILEIKSVLGD